MLEISEHLSCCPDCTREWQEINEVRRVLRAAFFHAPPSGSEQRLLHRVSTPEEPAWLVLLSAVTNASAASLQGQPPRGRRLATALAFSSLAVLMIAAPFAEQTRNADGVAGTAILPSAVSASVFSLPTAPWGLGAQPPIRLTDSSFVAAAPRSSAPPEDADASAATDPGPLRDATLADYVQSNAAWNDARMDVGSR